MTEVMTPSDPITANQVGKLQELLGARLRKSGLLKESVQQVLATQGDAVADEMVAAIRKRVEAISGLIIRIIKVNRARSPQEVLKACGRTLYVNDAVVDGMPRGKGNKAKLVYFKPNPSVYKNGWISCATLAEEYKKRGLVPDPQAQIQDNTANPEFADTTPNACQWVDADGKYCYAAFFRWSGGRYVVVNRYGDGWRDDWTFAGVPAS